MLFLTSIALVAFSLTCTAFPLSNEIRQTVSPPSTVFPGATKAEAQGEVFSTVRLLVANIFQVSAELTAILETIEEDDEKAILDAGWAAYSLEEKKDPYRVLLTQAAINGVPTLSDQDVLSARTANDEILSATKEFLRDLEDVLSAVQSEGAPTISRKNSAENETVRFAIGRVARLRFVPRSVLETGLHS